MQDKARYGKMRQENARSGKILQDEARHCKDEVRKCKMRQGIAR